jgi:dTDP-4-amino-4,6-dideoxygalactose transaminase
LSRLVEKRRKLAHSLSHILAPFNWIKAPFVEAGCEHSYYDYPIQFDLPRLGLSKETFLLMTKAENLPITESYRPLYWQDIYQKKIAFGGRGFPFTQSLSEKNTYNYGRGSCPVAESMYESHCLTFEICSYDVGEEHMERIGLMLRRIEEYARKKEAGNAART